MKLKELLYADLARQFELEGKPDLRPTFFRLLARLPHYRFLPIFFLRASRAAYLAGWPIVPHSFTYLNIVMFGLEVTPKCEIGPGVLISHPVGCVIGASRIGRNVTFVHAVMVGAIVPDNEFNPALRPVIGDNVVLGAGCRVLGGIEVGNGATVGANSVVIRSVPPNTTVMGVPAKVIFQQGTDRTDSSN